MIRFGVFVLALFGNLAGSAAFAQSMECSSPALVQEAQQVMQRRFAPPAIKSIDAIARGVPTPTAKVEVTGIEVTSQNQNIQKCSLSARVLRSDLREPINVIVQYTIYNRSTAGGFDVFVSP